MQEKLKEPRVYMCIAFFLILILPWMKVESKAEGVDAMGASMNGLTVFLTQLSVFCWCWYWLRCLFWSLQRNFR